MNKGVWCVLPGAACAVLVLLAACQPAQSPLMADRPTTEQMPVQGRQGFKIREQIRFGPYATADLHRSWTRGPGFRMPGLDWQKRRQQFSFSLRADEVDVWQVACETHLRLLTLKAEVDVSLRDRSELSCDLRGTAGEVWRLDLAAKGERPLQGTLQRDAATFEVLGTNKLAGGLPADATTAYELRFGGTTVGVAEVVNDGSVWLGRTLAPADRHLLASAAAALLVLEDLRAHLQPA